MTMDCYFVALVNPGRLYKYIDFKLTLFPGPGHKGDSLVCLLVPWLWALNTFTNTKFLGMRQDD